MQRRLSLFGRLHSVSGIASAAGRRLDFTGRRFFVGVGGVVYNEISTNDIKITYKYNKISNNINAFTYIVNEINTNYIVFSS